ncbi:hypothetical protein EON82_23050, partial [bacterium]
MVTTFLAALTLAQASAAPVGYVQTLTKPDGTFQVSTAAQRLVADGKPIVWLVGAMHIGAKPYYANLQRLLNYQDTVLYEGVRNGPKPATPAPGTANAKPVYQVLSDAIGLSFQMNHIRYDNPKWKNADLSWEELQAMNKRGTENKPTQFEGIQAMLDPNSPTAKMMSTMLGMATPGMKEAIKLMIVKNVASGGAGIIDPDTEKIILTSRNKAVVDALDAALATPEPPKSIGVFYGAMHLKDLEDTLVSKYG